MNQNNYYKQVLVQGLVNNLSTEGLSSTIHNTTETAWCVKVIMIYFTVQTFKSKQYECIKWMY